MQAVYDPGVRGSLFLVGGPRAMCAEWWLRGSAPPPPPPPPGKYLNFRRSEMDSVAFFGPFLLW